MGRNKTLDYLKLCLAAMVVGIHGSFAHDLDPALSHVLVDYVFRIGVPIFFMINGFYAAHIIGDAERFSRWGVRIAQLFAFWTLVYSPYFLAGVVDFKSFMYVVFVGFFHLWYLPATLAAGAVFHLLRKASDKQVMAVMFVAYGLGLFFQYAGNYHIFRGTQYDRVLQYFPIYRNFLCVGIPFFGMGLFIARKGLAAAIPRPWVNGALISGIGLMGAEYLTNQYFHVREGLDILLALPVLAPAVLLKALQSQALTASSEASDISGLIYFLHPLILKQLEANGSHGRSFNVLLVLFLVILSTPILVRINHYLKRFVGVSAI
jgi:surface polysaccharide O-acyltransferase-like enzyme